MTDSPLSVLVVEDEPLNLRIITAMLRRRGFEVTAAVDGQDALEQIDERWPDLILLDLMLPRMNGFQFLREFRGRDVRETPVVIVSAKSDPVDTQWAERLGADAYVQKPYASDALMGVIDRVVGQKRRQCGVEGRSHFEVVR